ncbi:helix-turn-helix domain-containing protein [Roseivirga sp.]|uniref:helix-turn-helix domain-containing protein n=1 Tax=Roseivirga sp. TaxID=1964215 RepID=UPI003B8AF4D1
MLLVEPLFSSESGCHKPFYYRLFLSVVFIFLAVLPHDQLEAQELPESFFKNYLIRVGIEYDEYIDLLEGKLDGIKEGSLVEATIIGHLGELYKETQDTLKLNFYKSKEEEYWSKAEVTSVNKDLFGQYLLRQVPISASRNNNEFLDSASQYIENKDDLLFIQYLRLLKTSATEEPEMYAPRYNDLLNSQELPPDIAALAHVAMTELLWNSGKLDSAIVLNSKVDVDNVKSMFTLLVHYMFSAFNEMRYANLVEAGRIGEQMKGVVRRYSGDKSKYSSVFYSTMNQLYTYTNQYDSAAFYSIKSINLLKGKKGAELRLVDQYRRLSLIYSENGEYQRALETARESIAVAVNQFIEHPLVGEANSQLLTALFDVYELTTNIDEKRLLIKELEQEIVKQDLLLLKFTRPDHRVHLKVIKGRLRLERSQDKVAEELFKEAISIANEFKQAQFDKERARYYLALIANKRKDYSKSIELGEQVLKQDRMSFRFVIDVHKLLISSYTNKGMVAEAADHINQIQKIIEDKTAERTKYLLSQSEVQLELESQKALNASLESEQLVKSQLIKRQQLIIVIIAASIAIIGFFVLRLKALHKKNLTLLQVVEKEGAELQFTNSELGDTIAELQTNQSANQQLLDGLSIHLSKTFNGIKGLKSFIPELGKLNNEQEKYLSRISDLVDDEELALNNLIALNSILGNHKIDIRRVAISDTLNNIESQMQSSLKLHQVDLDIDMAKGLVFLADRSLIEMSLTSLLQHGLHQELLNKKLKLQVASNEGLQVALEFKGTAIDQAQIDKWLKPGIEDEKNYLSKLSQLKDLMDGDLHYLVMGDLHKITLKLNLIELKLADSKGAEIDQLEIDAVYDKIHQLLVSEDGLTNPDLSMNQLSSQIGIPSRKLSFVINTREKTNFSKYLSRIRIDKVKQILDNGDHTHLNIAGIGYEAGFNSKSTFFSSFKEFVGCTPKEYLKSIAQEAS